MKSHKDLAVWKQAVSLAGLVYQVTKEFPAGERFGLTNQMRRAAVSIASNIAEGAARQSDKEFVHFLHIATGSASELDTQLEIAILTDMARPEELCELSSKREQISKMLYGLIRSIKQKPVHPN